MRGEVWQLQEIVFMVRSEYKRSFCIAGKTNKMVTMVILNYPKLNTQNKQKGYIFAVDVSSLFFCSFYFVYFTT